MNNNESKQQATATNNGNTAGKAQATASQKALQKAVLTAHAHNRLATTADLDSLTDLERKAWTKATADLAEAVAKTAEKTLNEGLTDGKTADPSAVYGALRAVFDLIGEVNGYRLTADSTTASVLVGLAIKKATATTAIYDEARKQATATKASAEKAEHLAEVALAVAKATKADADATKAEEARRKAIEAKVKAAEASVYLQALRKAGGHCLRFLDTPDKPSAVLLPLQQWIAQTITAQKARPYEEIKAERERREAERKAKAVERKRRKEAERKEAEAKRKEAEAKRKEAEERICKATATATAEATATA